MSDTSLENRVKTLEYEMKILKNEVQQILLDIQEQLLIHYYPALRGDDTLSSDGIRHSLETIREKKAALEEAQHEHPTLQSNDETVG